MKTQAEGVAQFRKRLAAGRAQWLIDIAAINSVTIDLTQAQQLALRRVTRRTVPSITLMFQSTDVTPPEHRALCSLRVQASRTAQARRSTRRATSRTALVQKRR